MRKTQLGLALVAAANLAIFSSPAFADAPAPGTPGPAADVGAPPGSAGPNVTPLPPPIAHEPNREKVRSGWIVVGIGGAATIAGIIVDAVGTGQGAVAGAGGVGDNGNTDNTRNDFYFVGTTLIVAGLATAFYGGSMVWTGNRGEEPKASAPSDDDAQNSATQKAVQAKLASSPTFTIPLLGAKF